MCFNERETRNLGLILKFRENFPLEKPLLRAHNMKSDEKSYSCHIYAIFGGKMVCVVIDRYFFYF